MSRFSHRGLKKVGSSPGTLVHVGERKLDKVRLSVMRYTSDSLIERTLDAVEEGLDLVKQGATTWINIDGTHDVSLMENIGRRQGIHPLTLEDVLNTTQRPKSEVFDDYLFVVLKMLRYDTDEKSIVSEQVSLILGENILIIQVGFYIPGIGKWFKVGPVLICIEKCKTIHQSKTAHPVIVFRSAGSIYRDKDIRHNSSSAIYYFPPRGNVFL